MSKTALEAIEEAYEEIKVKTLGIDLKESYVSRGVKMLNRMMNADAPDQHLPELGTGARLKVVSGKIFFNPRPNRRIDQRQPLKTLRHLPAFIAIEAKDQRR